MRRGIIFSVLVTVGGIAAGCSAPEVDGGGILRVGITREPSTWNRLLATGIVTHIVTDQLHASLIRLNQETQQMEPALAESWEFSEDGMELVFHLRPGVRFSDGEPFDADDVAFTFRVLHAPEIASPLADTARIDGEALDPQVVDASTVKFRLPRQSAVVERVFDSIRILPAHVLAESFARGTLPADTGIGAPIETIVGLGPFRLREHVPGLRVVLERNPYYWNASAQLAGIAFEIVSDPSAQLLRLRAGEIDVIPEPLATDVFRELRTADGGGLVVEDGGPSMVLERIWFNLNPKSPIEAYKKAWFADVRFRRAISLAIDRDSMAEVVFGRLASPAAGPVSPANRFWHNPRIAPTKQDLAKARRLLSEAGFRRDGDVLYDRDGNPVRFTLVTLAGHEQRARAGAFLLEDLKEIGIDVTLAPLDGGALIARITNTFDYDACLLGFTQTDPDPSAAMSLWLSRAPMHLWHPAQPTPATEWEARIDELMEAQMTASDRGARKAYYDEVQEIVSRELPLLDLVAPHSLIVHSERLRGLRTTPFSHALWNSDELSIAGSGGRAEVMGNSHVAEYP